ncbi:MAG: hypothetical protein P4M15_12635 [Alphaproteobacteria bacterium]|nr:hypothetical protein [Alphaproteobacteria bacterium]
MNIRTDFGNAAKYVGGMAGAVLNRVASRRFLLNAFMGAGMVAMMSAPGVAASTAGFIRDFGQTLDAAVTPAARAAAAPAQIVQLADAQRPGVKKPGPKGSTLDA